MTLNSDIENTVIARALNAPKKPEKNLITNEVYLVFTDSLCTSSTRTLKCVSISGFGMIKILALVLSLGFAFSIEAQTKIYKYTDEIGNVHFSDNTPSSGVKEGELKSIVEISTKQFDSAPNRRRETHKEKQAENEFDNFVMVTPANKATLSGTKGNVVASVNIEGDMPKNYRIKFYVDDLPHGKVKSKSQLIADVESGEHSIYAVMIDDSTRRVILTTPKTIFYLK